MDQSKGYYDVDKDLVTLEVCLIADVLQEIE